MGFFRVADPCEGDSFRDRNIPEKPNWNTVQGPFLHRKVDENCAKKGSMQKNGPLLQKMGHSRISYNSLISDKILNM